ncbi:MAG TPA: ABC transporter ATP-binding protein [Solirubrobacteraceae bacterium]
MLDRGQGRLEDEPLAMSALLEVEGLSVGFRTRRGVVQALSQASLTVQPGELLLVVGESGSGKTVLAHTLLRLLPRNVNVSGSVRLGGEELLELAPNELRRVRGRRMALIPQSPASSLNPVRKLGDQLLEAAQARGLSEEEARKRLRGLLTELGLDLEFISGRYVHQLSGGMQQRIVNAMALVGEPDVVIADEPTSGLDADLVDTTAAQLREISARGTSLLVITHDLRLAERLGGRLALLYASRIVELGPTAAFFEAPAHPYGRELLRALPEREGKSTPGSHRSSQHCLPIAPSPTAAQTASTAAPTRFPTSTRCRTASWHAASSMLSAEAITKSFRAPAGRVVAVDRVTLALQSGARLGLVGPSGSGKSTLAQIMAMLLAPDSGSLVIDGDRIGIWGVRCSRDLRHRVQLIFQAPRIAVDPRLRLGEAILEPLAASGMLPAGPDERAELLRTWAARVGLTGDLLERFPHEVSEGQLQRACLARALVVRPRYLICDELSSMLDVSTQAALLEAIAAIQAEQTLGVLLITHDGVLARAWCNEIADIRELSARDRAPKRSAPPDLAIDAESSLGRAGRGPQLRS